VRPFRPRSLLLLFAPFGWKSLGHCSFSLPIAPPIQSANSMALTANLTAFFRNSWSPTGLGHFGPCFLYRIDLQRFWQNLQRLEAVKPGISADFCHGGAFFHIPLLQIMGCKSVPGISADWWGGVT